LRALVLNYIGVFFSKKNIDTLIYLGSSLFGAIGGFVMLRYFTKYLDAADFGIFGYVSSVNTFLIPLLTLNLNSYYIKAFYEQKDQLKRKELLGTISLFVLIWTCIVTALLTVIGSTIFKVLEIKFPFYPYMFLTLLSNLFIGATTLVMLQYRMLAKPWLYFLVAALQSILALGLGYFFVAYFNWGVYGRIVGVLLSSVILGILASVLLLPYIKWTINMQKVKDGIRFSLPLIPYSLAMLSYDTLDRIFLERYSANMASTGIYNMGSQYAGIISMLSLAFYKAYEPTVFQLVADKNEKAVAKSLIMLNNVILILAVPLIVSASWILNFLTNGRFVESASIACFLIVAFYFRSAYTMLNTVLTASARTKEVMWFSIGGLLFILAASVIAVPLYNNLGTAYIKVCLYILLFLGTFLVIQKKQLYRNYMLHTLITGSILFLLIVLLKKNWL
jgi:O-antigen/teichoic acid export membrane protein